MAKDLKDQEEHQLPPPINSKKLKKPTGWGARHTLVLLGFFGLIVGDCMRHNLSLTIVAMVNHTSLISEKHRPHHQICRYAKAPKLDSQYTFLSDFDTMKSYASDFKYPEIGVEDDVQFVVIRPQVKEWISIDDEESDIVPLGENYTNSSSDYATPKFDSFNVFGVSNKIKFDWSAQQQGLILGSFFWGYLVTQIPGGCLTQKYGGKVVFVVGMIISSFFTLITPWAVLVGGMELLIVCRFFQGLGQGMLLPSMHGLLAKWIPRTERQMLTTIVYSGLPFGSAASMIVSGSLIQAFGWPSVFWILGSVAIVWICLWLKFISSTPSDHHSMSPEEFKYIENSLGDSNNGQNLSQAPWLAMLKSKPVWAILAAQIGQCWILYTFTSELPTYLKTVLMFDINQNSYMSAIPYLLSWFASVFLTTFSSWFIRSGCFGVLTSRKICSTIALWGSAAALVVVAFTGCDIPVTLTFLYIASAAIGGHFGGGIVNIIDIAPSWAGILMGVVNSVGSIPGIVAPWIAGSLINDDPSLSNWRIVFLIASAVAFVGNVTFIVFAAARRQMWDATTS